MRKREFEMRMNERINADKIEFKNRMNARLKIARGANNKREKKHGRKKFGTGDVMSLRQGDFLYI